MILRDSLLLFAASTIPALAVFPFDYATDSGGNFTNGGTWTGDGSVVADIEPGTFSGTPLTQTVVQDFSSGMAFLPMNVNNDSGTRVNADLDLSVSFEVVGGTADLQYSNSANFDGGVDKFNSIGLTDLDGVTSLSIRMNYSQFVAARDSAPGSLASRPMLAALGLVSAGAGLSLTDFAVTMSLTNPVYSTDGVNFLPGVGTATPFASAQWDPFSAGDTTFTADGFAGFLPIGASSTNFLMLRGYDAAGDGFDTTDAQHYYADEMVWTITPSGGATEFEAGTQFVFSLDGKQYANEPVPEPTVSSLLALLLSGVLVRRRR
ncbi:MAG: PEP-CTERM sorting domain-containing protein [Verrucomicrobiota bacterium]